MLQKENIIQVLNPYGQSIIEKKVICLSVKFLEGQLFFIKREMKKLSLTIKKNLKLKDKI